jgi:hypothetical protein
MGWKTSNRHSIPGSINDFLLLQSSGTNAALTDTEASPPAPLQVISIAFLATDSHIFLWRNSPVRAYIALLLRFRDQTQTHNSRKNSSGRVISPSHKLHPGNTWHSQETDIHARRRDSNPQSRPANNSRTTPSIALPLGSALKPPI